MNSKDIEKLKAEIRRLENNALDMFEKRHIPNDKNHKRLVQLKAILKREEMEKK